MHAAALLIFRQLANWYRSHVVSPSIPLLRSILLGAGPASPAPTNSRLRLRRACLGAGFAPFLLQALTGDADALLLVRVGWAERTEIRPHLADLSLVRAADDSMCLLVDGDLNPLGD